MTTLALPRGRQAGSLLIKDEATYGTAPTTGDYKPMPFYTDSLGASKPLESDPIIGADEHNTRDETAPAPGLISHGGDVAFPMCLNHLGDVLRYAFGNPVTTGAAADKTHTFASGAETLPSASIQSPKKSDVVMVHKGCVLATMGVNFSRSAGFRQVQTSWLGRIDEARTSALGTEATARALLQVPGTIAKAAIDGTDVGHVMSGQFTYNTGAAALDTITGDGAVSAVVLDNPASCEGQLAIRFTDKALHDLAVAGTAQTLDLTFELSATQSLVFSMPAITMARQPLAPIQGPGGMEATIPFRAAQTDADAMLEVVLKNQVASYA
jgi:hypothetical protein